MEANIVKKIVIEKLDVPDRMPIYREAVREQIAAYYQAWKDGEFPDMPVTMQEITYERMSLIDPETKLQKWFYVNVNERKLWEQLVAVSDGFINSKIADGVRFERESFWNFEVPKLEKKAWQKGVRQAAQRFKALPWYKRLFYFPRSATESTSPPNKTGDSTPSL